mmetsp:Transcript_70642/g.223152  ORF Transcript_70642/g.223152 Transcript_70642/m.223152 type:complete len:459 (-) Transcript_70642:17-1393(-)
MSWKSSSRCARITARLHAAIKAKARPGDSGLIGHRLLRTCFPQNLHHVAVERALGVVEGLLAVLVLRVDLGACVYEDRHALELLVHGGPHEGGLPALRVRLQVALPLYEVLHQHVVPGLHGPEQSILAVQVRVVHLRAARDEELADLVAAELRRQEQGGLALLGDKVDLCVLVDEALDRSQVALGRRPHQGGLVLVVELVHLGALLDEELADLPVAVRRRLHQRVLPLLRAVVGGDAVGVDEHVADVLVPREGRPHQHLPALVVLQVQGGPLVKKELDDRALALLCSLHEGSDALVVLGVQDALLLVRDGLLRVAAAQGAGLLLLRNLRLDEVLDDLRVPLLARLHERRLPGVVLERDPGPLLHQEPHHRDEVAHGRVHQGAHTLGVLLVHLDLGLLQGTAAGLHRAGFSRFDQGVDRHSIGLPLVALQRSKQVARHCANRGPGRRRRRRGSNSDRML